MLESSDNYLQTILGEQEQGVLYTPASQCTFKVLTEPKSKISGDKSFADDLSKQQGIVKSRVALLRRSSETKPFAAQICFFKKMIYSFYRSESFSDLTTFLEELKKSIDKAINKYENLSSWVT